MPFRGGRLGLLGLVLAFAGVGLQGCGTLPRGSGLQSEVLASAKADAEGEGALAQDFAVEPITRDNLALYASWPAAQDRSFGWPSGKKGQARLINPGDTVNISIWVSEDNSLLTAPGQRVVELPPMVVSASGQVFLPYIGQIRITGRTPEQARGAIEAAYADVAPSAQVQLRAAEGRQSSVSVVSGVAAPGSYPLTDAGVTVLDMLALAGGVAGGTENPQLRLQRGDTTYGISLDRVLKDTDKNVAVLGGDRIYVEDDARYFLSLGAAGERAQHHFPQDRVSALDALSIIGGLAAERANAQGILILRRYDEEAVRADGTGPRHARTIFTIDLTSADGLFSAGEFRILPGDLIYVTESPLIGTRNVLSLVGSVFGIVATADDVND